MIRTGTTQLNPRSTLVFALAVLLLTTGSALAEPRIEWLGTNYPLDVNADGSAVAGNTGDGLYDVFRWTPETGVVPLGMSTTQVFGSGAGTPDISDDGNRVSATIITPDSLYITQGLWTKGEGWEVSMPPVPPTGGVLDNSLGSCWGLSGDGLTLTGFYWRPGQTDGSAHTNTWSSAGGFTALPSPLRSCRGNDLNYDGSVVVGWSERQDGVWLPTVWEDGGYTVLHDQDWFTTAEGVSNDGNIIWGVAQDTLSNQRSAAVWLRTESGWDEQILGVLPGTFPGSGQAICNDRAEYTGTIVGYNTFDGSPFNDTGFVWTLTEGMMSAADYFTAAGVEFPAGFVIDGLNSISHNGNVIVGSGHDGTVFPASDVGFVVTLDDAVAVPDVAGVRGLVLESVFPNPFNPSTVIALSIAVEQTVRLDVFNARGQIVRQLHDGYLSPGRHELTWDGRDDHGRGAASGVYFATVRDAAGHSQSQRMMLVK